MARVRFTPNIQRHVECPPTEAPGATVHDVMEKVFAANPKARGYILDDQGGVRRHILFFIDGEQIKDRDHLSDPVSDQTEIYVIQSLSGG